MRSVSVIDMTSRPVGFPLSSTALSSQNGRSTGTKSFDDSM